MSNLKQIEKIEDIAKICHQANKAFCEALEDYDQVSWEETPEWKKNSTREGVRVAMKRPDITPEDIHIEWMTEKIDQGWRYGHQIDVEAKIHPGLLPFETLDEDMQIKDKLFIHIVRSFDKKV